MGQSGAGTANRIKSWQPGRAERAGVFHRKGGETVQIGWVRRTRRIDGVPGSLEIELEDGSVLKVVRVLELPLPAPQPLPVDDYSETRTWRTVDVIEQIAKDYLDEIRSFVAGVPEAEDTEVEIDPLADTVTRWQPPAPKGWPPVDEDSQIREIDVLVDDDGECRRLAEVR